VKQSVLDSYEIVYTFTLRLQLGVRSTKGSSVGDGRRPMAVHFEAASTVLIVVSGRIFHSTYA
jgi:hypothetical protein